MRFLFHAARFVVGNQTFDLALGAESSATVSIVQHAFRLDLTPGTTPNICGEAPPGALHRSWPISYT